MKEGESLAVIHANDPEKAKIAKERFLQAYTIGEKAPEERPLIFRII